MQAFLASDVIYSQRAIPELQRQFKERGHRRALPPEPGPCPTSAGSIPETVDTRLSRISTGEQAATPGLHGTGLQGVTAKPSGTALTEDGVNRIAASDGLTFDVRSRTRASRRRPTVPVSVSIKDGKPISVEQTISRIAAGDTQTVSIPITPDPRPRAPSAR